MIARSLSAAPVDPVDPVDPQRRTPSAANECLMTLTSVNADSTSPLA